MHTTLSSLVSFYWGEDPEKNSRSKAENELINWNHAWCPVRESNLRPQRRPTGAFGRLATLASLCIICLRFLWNDYACKHELWNFFRGQEDFCCRTDPKTWTNRWDGPPYKVNKRMFKFPRDTFFVSSRGISRFSRPLLHFCLFQIWECSVSDSQWRCPCGWHDLWGTILSTTLRYLTVDLGTDH